MMKSVEYTQYILVIRGKDFHGHYLRRAGRDWGPSHLPTKGLREALTFDTREHAELFCEEHESEWDGFDIVPVTVRKTLHASGWEAFTHREIDILESAMACLNPRLKGCGGEEERECLHTRIQAVRDDETRGTDLVVWSLLRGDKIIIASPDLQEIEFSVQRHLKEEE